MPITRKFFDHENFKKNFQDENFDFDFGFGDYRSYLDPDFSGKPVYDVNNDLTQRRDFISYLRLKVPNIKNSPHSLEYRVLKPGKSTISLLDLLGREGVEKYKAALSEEAKSESFKQAVESKSTVEGYDWGEKRPIILIGGPSSSGKSVATKRAIAKAKLDSQRAKINPNPHSENSIICVDGGIVREASQVRKLIIRLANAYGYTGISDLHENSQALEEVKEKLLENAIDSKNGIVIPETFSYWYTPFTKMGRATRQLLNLISAKSKEDSNPYFVEIGAKDTSKFREAVAYLGSKRAWNNSWTKTKNNDFLSTSPSDDPNLRELSDVVAVNSKPITDINSIVDITESKAYGRFGFFLGLWGTKSAKKNLLKNSPQTIVYSVNNDLILLKEIQGKWVFAKANEKNAYLVERGIYEKWLKSVNLLKQDNKFSLQVYNEYYKRVTSLKSEFANISDETFIQLINNIPNYLDNSGHAGASIDALKSKLSTLSIEKQEILQDFFEFLKYNNNLDYWFDVAQRNRPNKVPNSDLNHDKNDIIPGPNADFIREIICKATKELENTPLFDDEGRPLLVFDIQGRALVEIELTPEQLNDYTPHYKPSNRILVSIDVKNNESLRHLFLKSYNINEDDFKKLDEFRDSIIPLQQEMYCHLQLACKVYTKSDETSFPEDTMKKAHQMTMQKLQSSIIGHSNQAYQLYKNGKINQTQFIAKLDQARSFLSAKGHEFLAESIYSLTHKKLETGEKFKAIHAAEIMATELDYLHANDSLGLYTWISGSKVTSHNRGIGKEHLADRQIVTFNANYQKQERLQIRTPSLDVKDDKHSHEPIPGLKDKVVDISDKLSHLNNKYKINTVLPGPFKINNVLIPKAFTYNLYTAINDRPDDAQGKNQQSKGARVILHGAHLYNSKQLESENPFCLVQNISVNGYGQTLGHKGNRLRREATLMAELAMVYNLTDFSDSKETIFCETIFNAYRKFLTSFVQNNDDFTSKNFHKSPEGKVAKATLDSFKLYFKHKASFDGVSTPQEMCKVVIGKLMAYDLHYKYPKLVQTLSVFIEPASIGGCKSGNERAQAINGRVAILDSIFNSPVDEDETSAANRIRNAIKDFTLYGNVEELALNLKTLLDKEYDLHLQSALAFISHSDQGASSKVDVKKGGFTLNRNRAEESILKHLIQKNAGKMQAHKGLKKMMRAAWSRKSYYEYMKEQSGTFGALLSYIIYPFTRIMVYNKYLTKFNSKFDNQSAGLDTNSEVIPVPIQSDEAEVVVNSEVHPANKESSEQDSAVDAPLLDLSDTIKKDKDSETDFSGTDDQVEDKPEYTPFDPEAYENEQAALKLARQESQDTDMDTSTDQLPLNAAEPNNGTKPIQQPNYDNNARESNPPINARFNFSKENPIHSNEDSKTHIKRNLTLAIDTYIEKFSNHSTYNSRIEKVNSIKQNIDAHLHKSSLTFDFDNKEDLANYAENLASKQIKFTLVDPNSNRLIAYSTGDGFLYHHNNQKFVAGESLTLGRPLNNSQNFKQDLHSLQNSENQNPMPPNSIIQKFKNSRAEEDNDKVHSSKIGS